MAHFKLASKNPNLSWCISKHPDNMTSKSAAQGSIWGWFENPQEYHALFVDKFFKNSWSVGDYRYLEVSTQVSPWAYYSIFTEFFRSATRDLHEKDTPFANSITFYCVTIQNIQFLNKLKDFYSEDFVIEYSQIHSKYYELKISSTLTIYELVNFTQLILVFLALRDSDSNLRADPEFITKHLSFFAVKSVPYFVSSFYKSKVLSRSERLFEYFASQLAEVTSENVQEFVIGNTQQQRKAWVTTQFDSSLSVIDFGAGVDFSYSNFGESLQKGQVYLPVDKDSKAFDKLSFLVTNRLPSDTFQLPEKTVSEVATRLTEDPFQDKKFQVFLLEVLEHNTLVEAVSILDSFLSLEKVESVLVTFPNLSFNTNYGIPKGEFRHADHKWEGTEKHVSLFSCLASIHGYFAQTFMLGDIILGEDLEGTTPTWGLVFSKNKRTSNENQ